VPDSRHGSILCRLNGFFYVDQPESAIFLLISYSQQYSEPQAAELHPFIQ
jgi:hypothetical protein